MSPQDAEPAATQTRPPVTADAVLDAALTLFAERGYHGTAVSQIAAALGIRTPSLYNHMRSKQDLLEAIIGPTVDGVLDDFRAAVDGLSDPVERLRRAIRVYALRHAARRREALVANRDTTSLPEPARTWVRQREREHERAVRDIISDGVGAGDFHVDSPALASFAILEMCLSIARWFRDDGARTARQVADEYTDFALRIAGYIPDRPLPDDHREELRAQDRAHTGQGGGRLYRAVAAVHGIGSDGGVRPGCGHGGRTGGQGTAKK